MKKEPNQAPPLNALATLFDACARRADRLYQGLLVLCIGLFITEFFYLKHGHFDFENIPGFYLFYGFVAYCTIVLSAKQLRKILQRKEDYYDE